VNIFSTSGDLLPGAMIDCGFYLSRSGKLLFRFAVAHTHDPVYGVVIYHQGEQQNLANLAAQVLNAARSVVKDKLAILHTPNCYPFTDERFRAISFGMGFSFTNTWPVENHIDCVANAVFEPLQTALFQDAKNRRIA
jgi:hypothetical protein